MAYYKSIGLIGPAQSGKDSIGKRLGQRYGYQRVAFADPLKRAALKVDPLIPLSYGVHGRLSKLVQGVGWDYAKITYPEVRRVLQHIGQTVREIDPGFWVRAALPAIEAAERLSLPVVVTDVRYENEARALQDMGFHMIRVTRPGAGVRGGGAQHASETELANYPTALTIANTGTLDDLNRIVDSLLLPRSAQRR
ncbi:deoxynucleotide monophosphate kinase family protein [Streptomyces sp. AHA2]|uniref:deoxynucleotide monophosphate kinase family protein n=1 Tax=Streptomyces sp. AHA2 TaxID=3064526 RepID=UPI002FE0E018